MGIGFRVGLGSFATSARRVKGQRTAFAGPLGFVSPFLLQHPPRRRPEDSGGTPIEEAQTNGSSFHPARIRLNF